MWRAAVCTLADTRRAGGSFCIAVWPQRGRGATMALRAQHQQQDQRQETRNMAWMKRTALGLVAVALLAGAGAAVYVQRSFAQLDGSLAVAGLSEAVQVRRDGADVTHIQAQTPQDAWFAMGYVHAQEALQAYSKGIHAFHQKRPQALPPEFLVLGVQPGGAAGAVWEPEDSVGWALMIALDLGGNWGTEFARLSVARTLDTDRLWQLMPPYPGEPPAASADLAALYRQLGVYRAPAAGAAAAAGQRPAPGPVGPRHLVLCEPAGPCGQGV